MDLAAEDPRHTTVSMIALAGGALVIAAAALCYHIQAPRSPGARSAPAWDRSS
jgi:hypothetical protein